MHYCLYVPNTHRTRNLEVGGVANKVLQLLHEYEKKQNLNISLMTQYSEYKPSSNKLKIYQYNKFRIKQLNTAYFNLKTFLKIISLNKTRKIDVIFFFRYSNFEALIPFLLNFFLKIPILIYTPTDFDTYIREFLFSGQYSLHSKMIFCAWMKFFKKYVIRRKKVYIQAINQHIVRDLIELGVNKHNFVLIPNGITLNNFEDIRKIDHEDTNFSYIGRLIKTKNIRFLIKTFKRYLNHFPNDKLFIYGVGPEQKYILEFIKDNNLENNILLMGFEAVKANIYSKLDVLIHPSFGEGVSNTILEAALTKTFIIASNVKGNCDIIKHNKTGLLFNPFDNKDLLDKLKLFKKDKNNREKILKQAKEHIISNYSMNMVVDSQYDFIKSNVRF